MSPLEIVSVGAVLVEAIVIVVLDRRAQRLQAERAEEIRALTSVTTELVRALDRVEQRERGA